MSPAGHLGPYSQFLLLGELRCLLLALRVWRVFCRLVGALWGVRGVRHFCSFEARKGGGGRFSQIWLSVDGALWDGN